MAETMDRPLRVFLCHASQDKPAVRKLYMWLKAEAWIDPWLDEDRLLPGMDWDLEAGGSSPPPATKGHLLGVFFCV